MNLGKKPFEHIEGKGENAGNQHFLIFPQCFQPSITDKNHLLKSTFMLSSANALNFDQSKILSFEVNAMLDISYIRSASAPSYPCFLEFLFYQYSTQYSKPLAAFPQSFVVREPWILSQWLSLILTKYFAEPGSDLPNSNSFKGTIQLNLF